MMTGEYDPVKQGIMWAKVEAMDKKIDKMERQIEELLELANKGRGGFWAGMMIVSAISGIVGFFSHRFWGS